MNFLGQPNTSVYLLLNSPESHAFVVCLSLFFSAPGKEQQTNCSSPFKADGHARPSLARTLLNTSHLTEYAKFTFGQNIFFWQVLPPQDEFTAKEM